jgi:F-type H+-transporting ATPase subunit delta
MKNRVLVNKYAQGLVQAVSDEPEFRSAEKEIQAFLSLLSAHDNLRKALVSPFLNLEKKKKLLAGILQKLGTGEKTTRFLDLLLDQKRLELLDEITAVLSETWNESKGILTFEVASVIPLSEAQKLRLKKELEELEKSPVSLVYTIDPDLIGGLSLRKGHVVYDASVQGNLLKIKEQIRGG